jgi:adenylate kinase
MKNCHFFNIVLLGAPGSGKGTQASLIRRRYCLDHASTGEMFRREIAARTKVGIIAKNLINHGHLCPDEITLDMLVHYMSTYKHTKGFILDGVPRTLEQAQMMDGINYSRIIPVKIALYITINKTEIIERLHKRAQLINRTDDDPTIIQQRILHYENLTAPVVDYYRQQGILHEINGMQQVEDVFLDICKVIDYANI